MKFRVMTILFASALLTIGYACKDESHGDEAEAVEAGEQLEEEPSPEEGAAAPSDEDDKSAEGDEEEGGDTAETATVGEPAPDFELEDESGERHQLSDKEGEVVVLEWFNPDCPFVRRHHEEDKTMSTTLEELGDEDVTWLAVDSTAGVEAEDSAEAKDRWDIDYPILQDPSGEVGKLYEAKTTPHMYVIDEEGILRYSGAIDDDASGEKEFDERTNYVERAISALGEDDEIDDRQTKPYGCSVKYGS